MATQIAATPALKGQEAAKVYKEAHKKPSKNIEVGIKILAEKFEKKLK